MKKMHCTQFVYAHLCLRVRVVGLLCDFYYGSSGISMFILLFSLLFTFDIQRYKGVGCTQQLDSVYSLF